MFKSESFSEESETEPSGKLQTVDEFIMWIGRACHLRKGSDELILADTYDELEVSYNEDLQLRIENETTYKEQVAQLNSSVTTGPAEDS